VIGGLEQPRQGVAQLFGVVGCGAEITLDVVDRALQDVQPVTQIFELAARDDELVFAEAEFLGSAARFVVALTARRPAVHTRAARSVGRLERASAPLAPPPRSLRRRPSREFRHVKKGYDRMRPRPGINGKSSTDNNPGRASQTAGIALTSRPAVPAKPAVL
jgi:hypothetical protein